MYDIMTYYGIMRDKFISAVGFVLISDKLSYRVSLSITQYISYITLGALVINARYYVWRRTATIVGPIYSAIWFIEEELMSIRPRILAIRAGNLAYIY